MTAGAKVDDGLPCAAGSALRGVAVALGAIVLTRWWDMTPMWAGGFALLFVPAMFCLSGMDAAQAGGEPAGATGGSGAGVAPPGRLYLVAGGGAGGGAGRAELVAAAAPRWSALRLADPLQFTWAALGMIPGKMAMVRLSFPLPAERTEERYRFQNAARRFWIRLSGILFEWFLVVVLFGGALMHALSPMRPAPVWRWLVLACCYAVWGYGMIVLFRGMRR